MSTGILATKFETEELTLEIDMSSRCVVGESILTSVVSVSVLSGEDPLAEFMVSGAASVTNSVVSQKIINGVAGVVYLIECAGRSSLNNIFVNECKLAVRSDNAVTPAVLP